MSERKEVIENVFRHEYGKIMAVLVNRFGASNLEKIEDAVQDALLKAMQVWAFKEVPENPTAWLVKVAYNKVLDALRKDSKVVLNDVIPTFDSINEPEELSLKEHISDSQLKMIFACCHPSLSIEYQLVLSLKLIGGFGNKEIAKVLLKKEATVAKSFTRAKAKLKKEITTLDIPIEMGLQSRLFVVMRVIYLLFSEGYAPHSGELIVRKDVCYEAIRLALLLRENKYCKHPNLEALIALMCFHVARFDARIDAEGQLVDLEHQDRSKYNQALIEIGIFHLKNSGTIDRQPSSYHLQATVSYYHCIAKTFEETAWNSILKLYDLQLQQQYSPILQLNRIIPHLKVHGAHKALKEINNFEKTPDFIENTLYHAIKAEIFTDLGNSNDARQALKNAIELCTNPLQEKHLLKKLRQLTI